jgi:transposase
VQVLEELNRAKNRIEQLCQTRNVKVSSVATDLFGASGRRMLKAIVEGKHDACWMADYAKGRSRDKRSRNERQLDVSDDAAARSVLPFTTRYQNNSLIDI